MVLFHANELLLTLPYDFHYHDDQGRSYGGGFFLSPTKNSTQTAKHMRGPITNKPKKMWPHHQAVNTDLCMRYRQLTDRQTELLKNSTKFWTACSQTHVFGNRQLAKIVPGCVILHMGGQALEIFFRQAIKKPIFHNMSLDNCRFIIPFYFSTLFFVCVAVLYKPQHQMGRWGFSNLEGVVQDS